MDTDSNDKRWHAFTWIIENFSALTQEEGASIESPVFTAQSLGNSKWYLSLYPRGVEDSKEGYISCFLHRHEEDPAVEQMACEFLIEIFLDDIKPLVSYKYNAEFTKNSAFGTIDFIKRDVLLTKNAHSSEDVLSIKCLIIETLPKTVLASKCVARTCIGVDRNSFMWSSTDIDNPCPLQEVIRNLCYLENRFALSLKIVMDDIKIRISRNNFTDSVSMNCKISFLNIDGKEQNTKQANHLFLSGDPDAWKFPDFMKKSQLSKEKSTYLKKGCFTLKCDISISRGMSTNSFEEKIYDFEKHKEPGADIKAFRALQNDLKNLFISKIQTNVQLRANDKIFHAHKCILSSRSPVFLEIFNCDMVENQAKIVDIPNVDAETLNLFLEFMYTGIIKTLDDESAMHLLVVANKYSVFSLKETCSDFLSNVINSKNVCNVLLVADLVGDEKLRESVDSFIKKNAKTLFISTEWRAFVKNNPKLASDIILKVTTVTELVPNISTSNLSF